MEIFGIQFAPFKIPLERRLQTLAALAWIMTILGNMFLGWVIVFLCIYYSTLLRYPLLLYIVWVFLDRNNVGRGTRRSSWARNWAWWYYYRDYFPVTLVKKADLPPDKNYLLASFPHGILCSGSFASFATDACGFQKQYPRIQVSLVTLEAHFKTPFLRELAELVGLVSSSSSQLEYVLGHKEKGKAVALMVGGAQEAFYNKPGIYKIYLTKRKGFIRLALKHGTPLVPVFAFGEPDVFDQVTYEEGSLMRKIQDWNKRLTGVAPVIFNGRGVFQYSFGLIPRRRPIHVVVGEPIDVVKIGHPTQEQVDELHSTFKEKLQTLFDEEKAKYLENPDTELIIV